MTKNKLDTLFAKCDVKDSSKRIKGDQTRTRLGFSPSYSELTPKVPSVHLDGDGSNWYDN